MKQEKTVESNVKSFTFRNSQFSMIFMLAALLLMVLPFINTVNEFMTAILIKFELYRLLEDFVVPYEAKALAGVLSLLPVSVWSTSNGIWLNGSFLEIQWNCLGWQSAVLLVATYITGMNGAFSRGSRIEAIIIGILGTYLINFLRLALVAIFAITFGRVAASVFHDYFSLIMVVLWFFFFWWFSYSFVLEEREPLVEEEVVKV